MILATFGVALLFAGGAGSASGPAFVAGPCPEEFLTTQRVECGTISVPENRTKSNSRTIKVAVAIIHAASGHSRSDPIFFENGGPAIADLLPWVAGYFDGMNVLQDRDLILMDLRGEYHSGTGIMGCPNLNDVDRDSVFAKPYVGANDAQRYLNGIIACRNTLTAQGFDLSGYNHTEIVNDAEALRKALGIKQWNVWTISADGLVGSTYLRLFPGSIRAAILDSPQVSQQNVELDYLRGRMELLEKGFAGCAANAACNAQYPNMRADFYAYANELNRHPVNVFVNAGGDGGPRLKLQVTGYWLVFDAANNAVDWGMQDAFRIAWYSSHGHLQEVQQAEWNDPLEFHNYDNEPNYASAFGLRMSYQCHDDFNLESQADYDQAAAEWPVMAPLINSDVFGLPVNRATCKAWNNGTADPAQHKPFTSTVPTLITIGELDGDGGVPPLITRKIFSSLPNAFIYEFPGFGHIPLCCVDPEFNNGPVTPCAQSIAMQFLANPSKRPNSSCIASLPPYDYTP